jgi:hypothetical protein
MSRTIKSNYASLWFFAICIVLTSFFSACSGGSTQQSADTGDTSVAMPAGTGGVVFRLVWEQTPGSGAKALFTPPFNACVDHAIDTITAIVSNGTTTITSNSWPCSLHEGLILGVPAGTNFTVQINGLSSGPTTTTWNGVASAITVNAGQITNTGTIVMSYVGGDTTQPVVTSITPHSNPAITTNVPSTDRIIIAFTKPMAISTITADNIKLNLLDDTPVSGKVSYDEASNTAAFIPSAPLAYDTQYALQVISCVTSTCVTDTGGNLLASDSSNTFTIESTPIAVPAAPSSVTATPGNGQVTLDWLASNGSTSYNIYYLSTAGVTTTSGTLLPDVRAPFVHIARTNSQAYYYIVTAVNSFGESLISAEVSTTPVFPAGNPLPPASVTVTPGGTQNVITWSTVAGAVSYNMYWSTTPITPDKDSADNVVRGITSPFIQTGLTTGLPYCYIITAMNANGESAGSMQACGGVGAIQIIW